MLLANSTSSLMPGRGLINPAFVIKIVPATDVLQQKPSTGRDNPNTDYLDNLYAGSTIRGRYGKKEIEGTVERILKNEIGDVTYVIVIDSKGKTYKIESTNIIPIRGNAPIGVDKMTSSPGILGEHRRICTSFGEFLTKQ